MKILFAFVLTLFITLTLSKESYRGDQVVSFNLTTKVQYNTLHKLEEEQHVDIWAEHQSLSKIDIRIPQKSFEIVNQQLFKKFNIKYTTIVKDIQNLIDEETNQMKSRIIYNPENKKSQEDFFKNFRTIEEIHAWMKKHEETSKLVKIVSAGKTYEGRDILGMRIRGKKNKPVTLHHGAIHAREVKKKKKFF